MEVCDLQNSNQCFNVILEKWQQVEYWEKDETGNKKVISVRIK